jgi:hypothetical protein
MGEDSRERRSPSPGSQVGQQPGEALLSERAPEFLAVLESAAHLQRLVPDAVVVGGTAAALYADHRLSTDHDHVLGDLGDRFEMVLDAVEADEGWATNRVTPGKVILGNLDGIEAGLRQLIRRVPLETATISLPSGAELRVPTEDETLRIKAFLVVRRNQTRDYLDVAALCDHAGIEHAAAVLAHIDDYYADQNASADGVATQLVRQLSDPRPADPSVIGQLGRYKRLRVRWADWNEVRQTLSSTADEMTRLGR